MSKPIHLPDAMQELSEPALLVVCDSHEARFIDAGGRTLVEKETLKSKEPKHDEPESVMRGPSGVMSGTGDRNQYEDNRLRQFSNEIVVRIEEAVKTQGIKKLYISAPGRTLSVLKDHLPKPTAMLLDVVLDGIFIKEPSIEILLRFRPDLAESVQKLRDQENYSTKKHLPK
jgi:protein required for attachment to host cells